MYQMEARMPRRELEYLRGHVSNTEVGTLLGRPLCAGAAASTDGRRQSRSAVSGALLVQPWTRTSTGQRSFAAYGPKTDYQLPFDHQNCRLLHSSASLRPTRLFQH